MDNRPIGVFDSGLGGLTAVKALRQILPEEKLIYFGDTARVPYGGRSKETLLKYARQDVRFLRSFDLKAIVIACGTVSTTSLDTLQAENDLPIVGVVEPTCRRALLVTQNKKVGIIATLASIRSGAYEAMLRRLDPAVEIIGKPCPLFVPLVENGRISRGDVVIETVAREYLEPLKATGVDRHKLSPVELRKMCREYALQWIDTQRKDFKRLGVLGDWDHPYVTLDPHFEAEQIRVFGTMANKRYIYKGKKTVYWCPHCETALAEAEIEYADQKTPTIFVKMPLVKDNGLTPEVAKGKKAYMG